MTEDERRESHRASSARYYAANKDTHRARVRRWQEANPDKLRAYRKAAYAKDPAKAAEQQRRWQAKNRDYVNAEVRRKRQVDVQFRAACQISAALRNMLLGNTLSGKYVTLLRCTVPEMRAHLESKFAPGMSWATRGRFGWHIDHIKPLSAFDLSDPKQLEQACHYTNLQPLWWRDNMRKGASHVGD